MNREKQMPSEVVNTVENLIRYYLIRRRETVVQALLELFPRLVIAWRAEGIVGIQDIPAYHRFFEKLQSNSEQQYTGIWREVWDFHLHGIGCELVHRQTQERFDWDLSEPDTFSIHEFFNHLLWRIQKNRDEAVENYLQWRHLVEVEGLKAIFYELERQNRLIYLKFDKDDIDRELLPSGEWTFARLFFNIPEQWD